MDSSSAKSQTAVRADNTERGSSFGFGAPSVATLIDFALSETERQAWKCVLESSEQSESRYLHLRRSGWWFGIRIACHIPVYRCSQDYQQLIIPRRASSEVIRSAQQYLLQAIRHGGKIVADPQEVEQALQAYAVTAPLIPGVVSSIRHRLNHRAKWSYEIANENGRLPR